MNGRGGIRLNISLMVSLLLLTMFATASAGRIIYVDVSATGASNGTSWGNAYNCLQDALEDAAHYDEIRVAQGIYKPDTNSTNPNGTGDR